MSLIEVVRFMCDEPQCLELPCMTYDEAIEHAETHKKETLNGETIEAFLTRIESSF